MLSPFEQEQGSEGGKQEIPHEELMRSWWLNRHNIEGGREAAGGGGGEEAGWHTYHIAMTLFIVWKAGGGLWSAAHMKKVSSAPPTLPFYTHH